MVIPLLFLVLGCLLLSVSLASPQIIRRFKRTTVEADEDDHGDPVNTMKFCFNFAPVGSIRERLPNLPSGYFWESYLDQSSGEPVFTLNLVKIGVENKIVADRSANLYRVDSWCPWPERLRLYEGDWLNAKAWNSTVMVQVDWAEQQATKLTGGIDGYDARS